MRWMTGKVDGGLSIKKFNGVDTGLVVPAVIMKKPVLEIAQVEFSANPADSGRRSETAKVMYKVRYIVIKEGIKKIGDHAFAGCTYLESVNLPASHETISANAFEDCKVVTIYAPAGSYAERYAVENNIPFVAE